jgi:hypothetical protein
MEQLQEIKPNPALVEIVRNDAILTELWDNLNKAGKAYNERLQQVYEENGFDFSKRVSFV